jgi:hypothetical protein
MLKPQGPRRHRLSGPLRPFFQIYEFQIACHRPLAKIPRRLYSLMFLTLPELVNSSYLPCVHKR